MDLSNINIVSAIPILREYDGKNPYIKNLKNKLEKNGKISLTTLLIITNLNLS